MDPFADAWTAIEVWLVAEPAISANEMMNRVAGVIPDFYARKAQLRTMQRRVKAWQAMRATELVIGGLLGHPLPPVEA